jgi:hypothetical protein
MDAQKRSSVFPCFSSFFLSSFTSARANAHSRNAKAKEHRASTANKRELTEKRRVKYNHRF